MNRQGYQKYVRKGSCIDSQRPKDGVPYEDVLRFIWETYYLEEVIKTSRMADLQDKSTLSWAKAAKRDVLPEDLTKN